MALTVVELTFLNCYFYGIWAMAFLHNFLVSLVLFNARESKVSNFLKIVFNFCGIVKSVLSISALLTPESTEAICQTESYILNLANTGFRVSLIAFLLWRIKQIENKGNELLLGLVLLASTTILELVRAFSYVFHSETEDNVSFCNGEQTKTDESIQWAFIAIDFFIDLYVTLRLVHILSRANINAKFVASNMQKPYKRTLFTAVIYWNFLRLLICVYYHIISAIQAQVNNTGGKTFANPTVIAGLFTIAHVALSYVLTADAEIVRVIEGRNSDQRKGTSGSAGDEKLSKSSSSRRGQTSTISSTDYTATTSSPSYKEATANTPQSPSSDTKFVATMKRVSFFEWVKSTVGVKKDNENVNEVEVEDSIEEVRQDINANSDAELGFVGSNETSENRRGSDVSGATAVTANDNEKKHDPAP